MNDGKPLCIDLFCGYGGWARGFLDAGYRVIGFDNEPKCAKRYPGEFILADVRNLDGRRFAGARVIVASPPCTEFAPWAMPASWGHGRKEPSLELVEEAQRLIREARPEWWVIENVRGSVRFLKPMLGKPAHRGSRYLWTNISVFSQSKDPAGGKGKWRLPPSPERAHIRALIPYPLARALAEACLP